MDQKCIYSEQKLRHSSEKGNMILLLMSVIIAVVPDLNRYFPKSIWIVIILMWYAHTLLICRSGSSKVRISLLAFVAFLGFGIEILLRLIGYSSAEFGNYFIKFAFIDMLIKSVYIFKNYSDRGKCFIFRFIQVLIILIIIQNIVDGITIPSVHYLMYFYPERFLGKNVAMTEFYNMLVFFVGLSTLDIMSRVRLNLKILDAFGIAIAIYFMLSFEPRATATALTLLFIFLVLLYKQKSSSNRLIMCIALIFAVLMVLVLFKDIIISWLPERIAVRVSAILQLSGSHNSDDQYYARLRLFITSLSTFLSSPKAFLIGVGLHLGEQYSSVIGQHSFIVDTLAAYGCLGAIYISTVYSLTWRALVDKYESDIGTISRKLCLIVFIVASLLSTPIRPEIASIVILMSVSQTKYYSKRQIGSFQT